MKDVYLGDFGCWNDVLKEFRIEEPEPISVFAIYDTPPYEGYAVVIHTSDFETFYFVEGSHCSCHGLEDQWDEEDFGYAALYYMVKHAEYGILKTYRNEILKWMDGK